MLARRFKGMTDRLAPSTVGVVHGVVSGIVRAAVRDRLIVANPRDGIRLPKTKPSRVEPLPGETVHALADAVPARYRALVILAADPHARSSQALIEKLWRDVLKFHSWHPKKIRIPGEENDFTAIYQGLHILGEVRWFKDDEPMNGGKMREFLGKLDPRPQTVGMFVSHSGIDDGARSVKRRAVNSKTVIVFERADIESVLVHHEDIGEIFNRKLRDAYDFIFEEGQEIGG